MNVGTSTIAMTIYNLLAIGTGARTVREIGNMVVGWAAQNRVVVQPEQVGEAIEGLVRRKFIHELVNKGLFDVTDLKRRPVVTRDRTGDGWDGWCVHTQPTKAVQMVRLEDVVT